MKNNVLIVGECFEYGTGLDSVSWPPKERIEASCFEYDLKNFLLKITFFIKVLGQDPDPESMNLVPQQERSFLFVHHPSFTINLPFICIKHKVHILPGIPQCLSPCRNCDSPSTPSPQASVPPPRRIKRGGGAIACGWGSGIVPIPTTEEKA